METAYNTLKKSLKDAAMAAGANLEDLILVPENPEEIIAMFPSALETVMINRNEGMVHTRSSDVFRQKCSALRF